ncbi:hypothetical protein [Companilactobacillus mishanensis]|uniref:DUF4352 domain-containing protein n=1 Tax=Companilactobacillus mishanensis TaxID=2486008 RepID=A0A5P0ZES3_9LACO|nr:hypothetical protein [Companilactobacillus mishanensis]MQS51543.1 hypothetical protein [Companilactobacillus mishanensis]
MESKVFYKTWWFWLIYTAVSIMLVGTALHMLDSSKTASSNGQTTAHTNGKINNNSLTFNGAKIKIKNHRIYKLNFMDDSWTPTKVAITEAKILKLDTFKNENGKPSEANGMVILHLVISPSRDIKTFPGQGTLSTNISGETKGILTGISEFKTNWGGAIEKSVKKEGDLIFPIKNLSKVNDITKIKLQFDADYDTSDNADEDYTHNYDINLNLT